MFCLDVCLCNLCMSGMTDGCKLPHGCWELNLGPLEEQPVLLMINSETHTHPEDKAHSSKAENCRGVRRWLQVGQAF